MGNCFQPDRFDFTIQSDADLNILATYYDPNQVLINLTGYTAALQVKQDPNDTSALMNLTSQNGGLTMGGALGTIAIYSAAFYNALLPFTKAVYDLIIISPSGYISRLMYGNVTVIAGPTQLQGFPIFNFSFAHTSQYVGMV
jgi:hypothetical protein